MREFLGLGPQPDAAAAERGEKLFLANCSFCHGAKATGGDTGPDLLRSTLVLHDVNGDRIGPLVHDGRAAKGMPAFLSLTSGQLIDLAAFIHLRVEQAANRGTYSLANVTTGDPKSGKEYFNGKGRCSSCHSETGDLAHIGSELSAPDLQQTFLFPAARPGKPGQPPRVTIQLGNGAILTGTLKHLDDFTVTYFDTAGSVHSTDLTPAVKVEVDDKLVVHRQLLDQYSDSDMHNLTAYLVTLK
jgi:mono/diheme cytochrome c family protein